MGQSLGGGEGDLGSCSVRWKLRHTSRWKEAEVLFSLPSSGVLEYRNARRRGEASSQMPNVHSVWEPPSNRSEEDLGLLLFRLVSGNFMSVPKPAKDTLFSSQT